MQLRPHVELTFTRGPALSPPDALRAWLEQQGDRTVRLPVTLVLEAPHRIASARVGELPVTLDDSALGISLVDRLRQACPGQGECRVRLEGRWGPDFRVLHFVGPVAEGAPADFAEVAAP